MSHNTPTMSQKPKKLSADVLDDLASRFLINLPEEEKSDSVRLFFNLELCHWFYLDFYCTQEHANHLPCGIKQFAAHIFSHVPCFKHLVPKIDSILEEWRNYKSSVPTYGTILLTPDLKHVLLVQSFFAKNSWGFPKGKINEDEDPAHCAAREVFEETGYNCEKLINPNEYLEFTLNYQYIRLYIVFNVPIATKFVPRTRNEIKDCCWFPIDELPTSKYDDHVVKDSKKIRANSFYMIIPFIRGLKKWIGDRRQQSKKLSSGRKKQSSISPFFSNNGGNNGNSHSEGRHRYKSVGDSDLPNDLTRPHQLLTSTPINQASLFQSPSSAFRQTIHQSEPINSKKKQNSINQKTPKIQKQEPEKLEKQPENIKRKLFEDGLPKVKPFEIDGDPNGIPSVWKNFSFGENLLRSLFLKT